MKLDGVFYDDDAADWQREAAVSGARDVAAHSVKNVRKDKEGIYCDDDVTFNTGVSVSMPRITGGDGSCSPSAQELFQALKAKLEVRRSARHKISRADVGAHLSCSQADIALELRIYEQLNGAPPPLDIAQPPENKPPAENTPPVSRAGDAAAYARGNAGHWRGGEDGWSYAEEALTPSQLLGFDIAEV